MAQVLRRLPSTKDRNLLVGAGTADDAGVYRLDKDRALVQTVDFFTPIVDDPFTYGSIAAANALSDVYAMGGRPITAMNVMGVPADKLSPAVIHEILRGGAAKVKSAGCALVGGHTIKNPEPIYGLSVTGLVSPKKMMTNARARPGDLLVLTKPLGTGIATTGIKRGLTSVALAKKTIASMQRLNTVGPLLAEAGLVKAATDITGFGLLGHLASLCRASGVGATIQWNSVPLLGPELLELIEQDCVPGGSKANLRAVEPIMDWADTPPAWRILLADAQTSGGLLLCVPNRLMPQMLATFRALRHRAPGMRIIGEIVRSKEARIVVRR